MFEVLDQDSDGIISQQDLAATFKSVGQLDKSKDKKLQQQMLKESDTDLNFAGFLNLMVKKNTLISSTESMKQAFQMFDINSGSNGELQVNAKDLAKNLLELSEPMEKKEIVKSMDGFLTEDKMSGDKIFLAQRFIHSVGL